MLFQDQSEFSSFVSENFLPVVRQFADLSANQTLALNLLYVMLFVGSTNEGGYVQSIQLVAWPLNVFDSAYFVAAYGGGISATRARAADSYYLNATNFSVLNTSMLNTCPFAGQILYDRTVGLYQIFWPEVEISECVDPRYLGYSSALEGLDEEFVIDTNSLMTAVGIGRGVIGSSYLEVVQHLFEYTFRNATYSVDLQVKFCFCTFSFDHSSDHRSTPTWERWTLFYVSRKRGETIPYHLTPLMGIAQCTASCTRAKMEFMFQTLGCSPSGATTNQRP